MNNKIVLTNKIRVLSLLDGLDTNEFYRIFYVDKGFLVSIIGTIKEVSLTQVDFSIVVGRLDNNAKIAEVTIPGDKIRDIKKLNEEFYSFTTTPDSNCVIDRGDEGLLDIFEECYGGVEALSSSLFECLVGNTAHIYLNSGESFKAKIITFEIRGIELNYDYVDSKYSLVPRLKYNITTLAEVNKYSRTYSYTEISKIIAEAREEN